MLRNLWSRLFGSFDLLETKVEQAADVELEKVLPHLDPLIQKIVRREVVQLGAKALMRLDPQLGTVDAEATVLRLLKALDEMEHRPTVKMFSQSS